MTHQNDVRKASFFGQKYLFSDYSHHLVKKNRAHYLSHTTVRVDLKDLPAQSLVCISCLSSRYSQVSLSYTAYQNSDNRFKENSTPSGFRKSYLG